MADQCCRERERNRVVLLRSVNAALYSQPNGVGRATVSGELSNDASLSALTADGTDVLVSLLKNLANGATDSTIIATPTNVGATVTINGTPGTTLDVTGLATGDNAVAIVVTAADTVTQRTYNLNLHVLLPAPVLTAVTLDNTTPTVGDTITATPTGTDLTSVSYVWKADGMVIAGQTAATYVTDRTFAMGHAITATGTGHNESGDSSPVASSATSAVTGAPVNTVAPLATSNGIAGPNGPAIPGDTVSTDDGAWTGYPAPGADHYTNTFSDSGSGNSAVVGIGDVGNSRSFTVFYGNGIGGLVAATSNGIAVVASFP